MNEISPSKQLMRIYKKPNFGAGSAQVLWKRKQESLVLTFEPLLIRLNASLARRCLTVIKSSFFSHLN